jgi:hypothetical protein
MNTMFGQMMKNVAIQEQQRQQRERMLMPR